MADITTMEQNMTIFYSKASGDIKSACGGIQNMNFFGENAEDFSLIWDYIVIPKDEQVMRNLSMFKVNLETKELELKATQYPIAQ